MERDTNLIQEYLMDIIEKHKGEEGIQLPSENFLVTKFKVSRTTVRTKLAELQSKGIIHSVRGSGYFTTLSSTFSKLYPIGNESYENRKVILLEDKSIFYEILKKLNIENNDLDINDFFSYTKIFTDNEDNPRICNNSYIYKKVFKEIDIVKITESLMGFIDSNDISLDKQINKAVVEETVSRDYEILKITDQTLIPVVYGALYNKEGKYVELFQRRYHPDDFIQSWVKFF